MKKIKFLILSIAITTIIACNSNNQNASNKENSENLTTEKQKVLNTFFSNFAEAYLENFKQADGISNDELIRFGIMYNYINNRKRFTQLDEYNVKIKKEFVEETAKYYFDKPVASHKSIEGVGYNEGFYSIPLADGESLTFAQVEKISDLGNSNFSAIVNVYSAGSGWTGDVHANPSAWAKDGDSAPTFMFKVNAIYKQINEKHFVLLEYIKEDIK